jgi:protein SCO1
MKSVFALMAAVLAFLLVGCREKAVDSAPAATATTNDYQFYLVRGVVKKVEPAEKTVSIQHEEIPKYMPAMTMPFKVKDAKELQGLEPGDTVWFRLCVGKDESWIVIMKKEGKAGEGQPQASATTPEREAIRVVRDVEPLKVGDLMPDYQFTNELGRTVHLKDFLGKALAFTFIYTRCPLPDFCPRMSRNFSEVYEKLSALPNGPTNWHLLTITFDPHFDTPAVLRSYAQAFQYHPERWNFVTGAMVDIDAITDQFELIIVKQGTEWNHKVRTVVVDANGRVQAIIYGNEWKPDALVEEIVKAAAVKPPLAASQPAPAAN